MKKIILSMFLILLLPAMAFSAPFIISDPSQECATCFYERDGDTTQYPTEADGSIKHDLQAIVPGAHALQFRYGRVWTADASEGELPVEYSDWSLPFHLERPGALQTSTGHKLSR